MGVAVMVVVLIVTVTMSVRMLVRVIVLGVCVQKLRLDFQNAVEIECVAA